MHEKKVTMLAERKKGQVQYALGAGVPSRNAWMAGAEGVGNMAGRRRRPSKSNRRGLAAIAVVVLVLLVTLMVQSQKLKDSNQQYESQKAELEQQIRDEELRTGEIENLKDYVNSKEYIEKIAREKLGLVYEDDIIFKAEG